MHDDLRHPDAGKTSKTFNDAASGRNTEDPAPRPSDATSSKTGLEPVSPGDGPKITLPGANAVRQRTWQVEQDREDAVAKAKTASNTPNPDAPVKGEHPGESLLERFERQAADRSSPDTKEGPEIKLGERKNVKLAPKFNREAER